MKKRSITISGHATSVTLEEPFWDALKDLAKSRNVSVNQLVAQIDETKIAPNLSSAIRIYILKSLQQKTIG